jgi:hypothetical protein
MGRHQHMLGHRIGWGTASEAGRRATSVYFTHEYPADPAAASARIVEVKPEPPQQQPGAGAGPHGRDARATAHATAWDAHATGSSDIQDFRNARSAD